MIGGGSLIPVSMLPAGASPASAVGAVAKLLHVEMDHGTGVGFLTLQTACGQGTRRQQVRAGLAEVELGFLVSDTHLIEAFLHDAHDFKRVFQRHDR